MPTVAETSWGLWGASTTGSIFKMEGAPKLNCDTGGELKPGYEQTVAWYQQRATNVKDKEHCARLLTHFRQHRGATEAKKLSPKRPNTAPSNTRDTPPKPTRVKLADDNRKSSYQKQILSVNRLSRPKTASTYTPIYRRQVDKTQEYKYCPRPKSAMADLGERRVKDPYLTTHDSEYVGYPTGRYAEATRPMTSNGFATTYNRSDPIGTTTVQEEFNWKTAKVVEPIRSGTSSGNRRNNPHPHKSFMQWRLAKKGVPGMIAAPARHLGYRKLDNNMMNQILKDQLKSTYQNDYLGIPQGYQMKDAIDAPHDWRAAIARPLDTTMRQNYSKPKQQMELTGNTTRYGCNKKKNDAAQGAVPTVTKDHVTNQAMMKSKTSYENEFSNRQSNSDLNNLLNERTNHKIRDSFLRYSRIMEDSKTKRQEEERTKG